MLMLVLELMIMRMMLMSALMLMMLALLTMMMMVMITTVLVLIVTRHRACLPVKMTVMCVCACDGFEWLSQPRPAVCQKVKTCRGGWQEKEKKHDGRKVRKRGECDVNWRQQCCAKWVEINVNGGVGRGVGRECVGDEEIEECVWSCSIHSIVQCSVSLWSGIV